MIYQDFIKRILDIFISLILLIPITFVCLIFGFFILIEDSGSMFYCQERLGKHKKIFKMYKLRSMKMNAPDLRNEDGSTYNADDDPRLLKIGNFIRKTSIDELPQIFNVLKGDMSLIGPRPDLATQAELYIKYDLDQTKFEVRPGITGYAQCHGRNEISWKDKLALDHYYVDHISCKLDISIFFRTVYHVLKQEGVNKK